MEWRAQSRRVTLTACMDDMREQNKLEPRCGVQIMTTRTRLLDYSHMGSRVHHSRVHVNCVESAQGLGGVVRLVARCQNANAIPTVELFPSAFCTPTVHL